MHDGVALCEKVRQIVSETNKPPTSPHTATLNRLKSRLGCPFKYQLSISFITACNLMCFYFFQWLLLKQMLHSLSPTCKRRRFSVYTFTGRNPFQCLCWCAVSTDRRNVDSRRNPIIVSIGKQLCAPHSLDCILAV